MDVRAATIPEVKILTPRLLSDERGFFSGTYRVARFAEAAGTMAVFVQDNQSLSRDRGIVRGLHFQTDPSAQGKLIHILRGAIIDVAVDIRQKSPPFGRHVVAEISARNWSQIWITAGFARGFCTLEPFTRVVYKTTACYDLACDKGPRWNDPARAIAWPVGEADAILAELPAYFT
jgi:dTDP-4-dehydrorhamnose 3,5-epimerase